LANDRRFIAQDARDAGSSMTGLEDLTRPGLALIAYVPQSQLLLVQ